MGNYRYELRGTAESPCMTDYRLLKYDKILKNAELTVYEEKSNLAMYLTKRAPKFFVILEYDDIRKTYFVGITIVDKRRKPEPFNTKEMLERITNMAKHYVEHQRRKKEISLDESKVWNQI